jgi:hypothetical protein
MPVVPVTASAMQGDYVLPGRRDRRLRQQTGKP